MFRVHCTILFVLASAARLLSAPLDRHHLPADVKWFIHFDVDSGRKSTLGQAVLQAVRADAQAKALLGKFQEHFNLDPTQDIHEVTVYGTEFSSEAGVLIVRGKVDQDRLKEMLHKAPAYREQSYRAHPLYSWNESGSEGAKHSFGAFFGEDAVLVGSSELAVRRALDVLDGSDPVLFDSQSPLAKPGQAGSIVEAGVLGLADARGLPIQSPVLRQCDYGLFWAGERDGVAFSHGIAVTRTPDVADKVRALIQGAVAFAQLSGTDVAARLLSPVRVTGDDRTVEVNWHMPAGPFAELVVGEIQTAVAIQRARGPETKP